MKEELGAMRSNMLTLEAVWLERILKQSETEHKRVILLMHRSPWSTPYSGAKDVNGIAFLPLIDKYEVPLVFTAHEHCYARSSPLREGSRKRKELFILRRDVPDPKLGQKLYDVLLMLPMTIAWTFLYMWSYGCEKTVFMCPLIKGTVGL